MRSRRDLRPVQRVAAYAIVRSGDGGLLVVRASPRSAHAGHWALPGGSLRHGESPPDAVVRTTFAETGVRIRVGDLSDAVSDVVDLPHHALRLHTLRLLYAADWFDDERPAGVRGTWSGEWRPPQPLTHENRAGVDAVQFVRPDVAIADGRPLMPYLARLMGGHAEPLGVLPLGAPPQPPDPLPFASTLMHTPSHEVPRVQRSGAYAVVVQGERLLLTRLAGGSRRWTLPGGGIDHGETPVEAVRREVYEEAGLPLTVGRLLGVDSTHFTGRNFAGRLEDFHGIRIVYAGEVPSGLTPHVVEVDGTTEEAAWIALTEVRRLPRTSVVDVALSHLRAT